MKDNSRQRCGFARFLYALLGLVLFFGGALVLIAGSSGVFEVTALGLNLPPETPGMLLMAASFVAMFRAGRQAAGDDDD